SDTEDYVAAMADRGAVYLGRNQLREVLRITQQIGAIHDRNGRGGTATRLIIRQNAALVLADMGEVSGALQEREIIQQHLHDVESPGEEPFPYAINYAAVLLRMDRPDDSMHALEGTLERARQSGNQIIVARTLLMRGSILVRMARWDEAETVSKEALALAVGEVGNKSYAAQAESLLAQVDLARGNLQSAHTHTDK